MDIALYEKIRNYIKFLLKKLKLINFVKEIKYSIYKFKININYEGQDASNAIFNLLNSEKPVMICRFGNTEISRIIEFSLVLNKKVKYDKHRFEMLKNYSGFFPIDFENLKKFHDLYLNDIKIIDVLACWTPSELFFKKNLENSKKISIFALNPWEHKNPWSKALEGKKVLVIHPFVKSIKKQYKIREKLFENKDVLPKFELKTLKAVQTLGGKPDKFNSWFDALEYMKKEINKIDFDIAIIGCGAYGLPLAAHVKRTGKKAVHVGGTTQLLFGIKGSRWENINYKFINKYWIKPLKEEIPKNKDIIEKEFSKVESGIYW